VTAKKNSKNALWPVLEKDNDEEVGKGKRITLQISGEDNKNRDLKGRDKSCEVILLECGVKIQYNRLNTQGA